ncbi:hypothetical protein ACGFIK_11415 [Micromonospora sp. NPDC048871]|uniref:hypothetical protein n=1 Tax=Micromonospora sp. NPDC048871 TaxID=3364259 RepID=UPI00372281AD
MGQHLGRKQPPPGPDTRVTHPQPEVSGQGVDLGAYGPSTLGVRGVVPGGEQPDLGEPTPVVGGEPGGVDRTAYIARVQWTDQRPTGLVQGDQFGHLVGQGPDHRMVCGPVRHGDREGPVGVADRLGHHGVGQRPGGEPHGQRRLPGRTDLEPVRTDRYHRLHLRVRCHLRQGGPRQVQHRNRVGGRSAQPVEGRTRHGTGGERAGRRYPAVMATPAELYAAILAAPDALDLRRRFADAIEATDPDHAELIRAALAGTRPDRAAALRYRRVVARLAAPVAHRLVDWKVRHGLVELVTMTARAFVDHGAEVFAHLPVRHLTLVQATGLMPQVAAVPSLGRLVALDLSDNPIGDDGLAALTASAYLGRLRWLGLASCGLGPAGAEALAASRNLPALRYVEWWGNSVEVVAKGVGQDIDGRPVGVEMPPLGRELDARYGPLPWLDIQWGWRLLGVARWDEV